MIRKQILLADRVRRPPAEGWSWVDRRFLREYAARLSRDGILLYFFLAAVSDKNGLSCYREARQRRRRAGGRPWEEAFDALGEVAREFHRKLETRPVRTVHQLRPRLALVQL